MWLEMRSRDDAAAWPWMGSLVLGVLERAEDSDACVAVGDTSRRFVSIGGGRDGGGGEMMRLASSGCDNRGPSMKRAEPVESRSLPGFVVGEGGISPSEDAEKASVEPVERREVLSGCKTRLLVERGRGRDSRTGGGEGGGGGGGWGVKEAVVNV